MTSIAQCRLEKFTTYVLDWQAVLQGTALHPFVPDERRRQVERVVRQALLWINSHANALDADIISQEQVFNANLEDGVFDGRRSATDAPMPTSSPRSGRCDTAYAASTSSTNKASPKASMGMAEPTSPPCVATSAETGVSGDAWLLRAIAAPFYKPYCSEQHETITAYSPRPSPKRDWLIATEEGVHNVRVCRYEYQEDALAAFDKIWCSRVLYNPNDEEVKCAGVNRLAINTIRRVMKSNYFADK